MMNWDEVVMLGFSCVAANHLGLVAAVENTIRHSLPIINCSKCLTFWTLAGYGMLVRENIIVIVATSFLFAYLATWLELAMGFVDTLYVKLYEKIYPNTTDDTTPAAGIKADTDSTVSQL